jgi:hypothetical protein
MPQVGEDAVCPYGGRYSYNRIFFPKVAFLLAVLFSATIGCRDEATTWSAESRSPDGNWLATARSTQGGSFGGAYDVTAVNLKWIGGSQPPVQVLLFSHEFSTMNLKMDWVGPKHLDVAYGGGRPGDEVNLEFQAIKCAGVDISVRDLSKVKATP